MSRIGNAALICLIIACIFAVLLKTGYLTLFKDQLADEYRHYTNDLNYRGDKNVTPDKDLKKFQKKNKDITYMLKVPKTSIHYPVANAEKKGNRYYLERDAGGASSVSGTLFLDARTPPESRIKVIHGHHMNDGSMFGVLEKFKNKKYAKKHKYALLSDKDGTKKYELCYVLVTSGRSTGFDYYRPDFGTEEEKAGYLLTLEKSASIKLSDLKDADSLLVLSTCSYEFEAARTVLFFCEVEEENEEIAVNKPSALLTEASFAEKVNSVVIVITAVFIVILILHFIKKRRRTKALRSRSHSERKPHDK